MRSDRENPWMAGLFAQWAYLSEDAVKTWRKAMGDVRRRRYTPGKMFSDVLGLWMGGVEAWCSLGYGALSQPRHLLFVIAPDTEGDQKQELFMEIPGRNTPDVTELSVTWPFTDAGRDDADTSYKMINKHDNVRISTTSERNTLTVALIDLAKKASPPPPPSQAVKLLRAVYEGLIFVDEEPLGILHVVVR
jgi:hypothetical protein